MADAKSMMAILGLLAVVGYQNRDKIASVLNGLQTQGSGPSGGAAAGGLGDLGGMLGGLLGGSGTQTSGAGLGGLLSGLGLGTGSGDTLTGGLGGLLQSFENAGQGEVARSWVDPSVPTQPVTTEQVAQAIGDDNIAELAQKTGLSRDELLKRLATAIPQTVDKLTPNGRMPGDEKEALHHLAN